MGSGLLTFCSVEEIGLDVGFCVWEEFGDVRLFIYLFLFWFAILLVFLGRLLIFFMILPQYWLKLAICLAFLTIVFCLLYNTLCVFLIFLYYCIFVLFLGNFGLFDAFLHLRLILLLNLPQLLLPLPLPPPLLLHPLPLLLHIRPRSLLTPGRLLILLLIRLGGFRNHKLNIRLQLPITLLEFKLYLQIGFLHIRVFGEIECQFCYGFEGSGGALAIALLDF